MNAILAPRDESVFARIGRLLGIPVKSEADLLRIGQDGVTAKAFRRVAAQLALPPDLIGPATTMRRRLDGNERFTQPESERLLRIARVFSEASRLFDDDEATKTWMRTASTYVPGQPAITPLELATSDSGARLLEESILRTAHGIF